MPYFASNHKKESHRANDVFEKKENEHQHPEKQKRKEEADGQIHGPSDLEGFVRESIVQNI
jgi:hypothetical protein